MATLSAPLRAPLGAARHFDHATLTHRFPRSPLSLLPQTKSARGGICHSSAFPGRCDDNRGRIGRGEAAGEGRAVPFAREEGSRDRVKGFISWRVQSGPVSYSRGRTTTSVRVHTICMHNSCACEHVHVHVHAHVHVTCTCLCLYHNTQDHGETVFVRRHGTTHPKSVQDH
jgi:hypothetical protein